MDSHVALIGFGEAGAAFAGGASWNVRAFDIKTDDPVTRGAKLADYDAAGVTGTETLSEAVEGAGMVISLVTADQALGVAETVAALLASGAYYCDFNSVAPQTKQQAGKAIQRVGGHYVDVAVMSPVLPARLATPLFVSGLHPREPIDELRTLGFTNVQLMGVGVGGASAIKMVRSLFVKGLEALTAEVMQAAHAAGVREEVLFSLQDSWPGISWNERADYNLERMMVHGLRRAAEMEEVMKTLEGYRVDPAMTRGTVERQRAIGALGVAEPPEGLADKLELLDRLQRATPQRPQTLETSQP